ncbi:bifunctional S-phase kinase-associated protein 1-like/SKP1-BTB-POZ domain superfamily/S-phase kinase-associated protein 1/SKP1-like [Babesia duncani]|uniref:Bifunctional S-phase kinase-associated protein 1-like/SKP1-BTB-POZ domain superfamily/S-phase kinase-associated protein 1/SKP1-like n=1 Tax=Babesia duncani TaxID=323732 RepID=A0AAD9PHW0_9APIC|nr:bifunctional S-phase kinase-associated protein 1-like/SKP1-BTB-POZ domain superfamily/S-phase kinase-associated protein 1/SKP1-like [Babesia duncani]
MQTSDQIILISAEGDEFTVDRTVMRMSGVIRNMIEDTTIDNEIAPITLSNISTRVLSKIIEYCTHHHNNLPAQIPQPLKSPDLTELVSPWDLEFINIDKEMLFDLILAENYLDIKPLLELTCAKVASLIKDKTPEQIRREFGIINDFTPEQEAVIREENKWCEEL